MQGDVAGLANTSKQLVAEYRFDPWGRQIAFTGTLAGTLGVDNPFRYRGYLFDEETGLYYLRSRYYNPSVGRFLNADSMAGDVGGEVFAHNVFIYCCNNPVMSGDPDGGNRFWMFGIEVLYAAWFHLEVQYYVWSLDLGILPEIGKGLNIGRRRVDLYKWRTNEIWEIKPMNPISAFVADAQLDQYIATSTLPLKKGVSLTLPASIQSKTVSGVTIYLSQPSPGVILYYAKRNEEKEPVLVASPAIAYEYERKRVQVPATQSDGTTVFAMDGGSVAGAAMIALSFSLASVVSYAFSLGGGGREYSMECQY